MKRIMSSVLCLVCLFAALCSCGGEKSGAPVLPEAFSAKAQVLLDGEKYSGTYTRLSDSVCSFTVEQPQYISGMQLVINNGLLSVVYDGLSVDVEIAQDVLPDEFSAQLVSELLMLRQKQESSVRTEDEMYVRTYSVSYGDAVIYQDPLTGFIRRVVCDPAGFEVCFDNAAEVSKVPV